MQPTVTQRHVALKRAVLGPLVPPALAWARSGRPTAAKATLLRRVVVPGAVAADRVFEREVPAGFVFGGHTRDLLELYVHLFGVWEPNLTAFLSRRLTPGSGFVDVGANSGWFTTLAASRVGPGGTVVAVEASPVLARRLKVNLARNGADAVRVVVAAAGRERGRVVVELGPAEHTGITSVRPVGDTDAAGTVPCAPLPELLTEQEIAAARVVKIDVEGAEYDVVAGLAPALDRFPDGCEFVVEVGPGRAAGTARPAELFDAFASRGYCAYRLPNDYTIGSYLSVRPPRVLDRMTGPPEDQTDVVFSRTDVPALPV